MKYVTITCIFFLVAIEVAYLYRFGISASRHQSLVNKSHEDARSRWKYTRRKRIARGGSDGYCDDGNFTCDVPYSRSSTIQFECMNDRRCPSGYKCCPQKCFQHKICMAAQKTKISNRKNKNCNYDRPGQCEKWPYDCQVPYHYSYTSIFKCDRDTRCPKGFKCCKHNCFVHKICSRIVPETPFATHRENVTENINNKSDEDETTEIVVRVEETETPETTSSESTTSSDTTTKSVLEEEYTTSTETESTTPNPETTTTEEVKTTKLLMPVMSKSRKQNKNVSSLGNINSPDSNAIDPNYAEYYYHYDDNNNTTENDDNDDYGDDEDDYNYTDEDSNNNK